MDRSSVVADIDYIKDVVRRSHRRIDGHCFHSVHWGLIVLVWYPVVNFLANRGMWVGYVVVSVVAFLLGSFLSGYREHKLGKNPRMAGENTYIGAQIEKIVFFTLGVAVFLSMTGPPLGYIPGPKVMIVWGVAYSVMAYMIGVVYTREYRIAGLAIMVGAILAMIFPRYQGYILGPFMGIGAMVPGIMGERRVARIIAEDAPEDVAG